MNLLAPLYVAGALAVALPIIFHLIRRTPHKKQTFSSLMFLTPSPPRLTRRSRLSNILLLLLRAAVLALLAIAFARPFFLRKDDLKVDQTQGRRVAILVDTSASMQRGDLWKQAKDRANDVLNSAAPSDQVALYFFDRSVRPAFTFAQWNQIETSQRVPMLRAQLDEAKPTFAGTNLGEALASVADQLAESDGPERATDTARRLIVLISDLQAGSHVEALQGHEWPEHVLLDVKPVAIKQSTNASLQLIREDADAPASADTKLRVRVTNQPGSTTEQFSITWANDNGPIPALEPQKIYIPPGRSQVVRVALPAPETRADRLILSGDDFDFDNTLFVVPPRQENIRIVYLGDDAPEDAKQLNYYLHSALTDTPQRKVEIVQRRSADQLIDPDLVGVKLVVVTAPQTDARATALRRFVEAGGDVLWVLKDAGAAQGIARLMQIDTLDVKEAAAKDFALISRVDLTHPLFATFADTRFGDFSKIHFWKHRTLKLADANTIATFDNGDAFLIEKSVGQGRLRVMTSGWQPEDSQLALSTKFVPLIGGFVQKQDTGLGEAQYAVGDTIRLPDGAKTIDKPGIVKFPLKGETVSLAINLAPDESRTTPLAPADLEQWGAKTGDKAAPEVLVAKQRELKLFELENRQKIWRWLIVLVLGLVFVETVVAGVLARRGSATVPQVA